MLNHFSVRVALAALLTATAADAQVTFTTPQNTDTIFSLPIAVTGTQSATASAVFLEVIQDPAGAVPPAGTGGATTRIAATLTSATTWEATLNLLNGPYRLRAFSDVDLPASIDVTVAAAGNPTTLQCVTDPGGGGVQAPALDWTPQSIGGPSVTFNFSRSADPPAGVELDATPTSYAAGTDFVCTQNTNGRIPRVVIIGADPKLAAVDNFAGWSFDGATSTLTIRMKTVSLTLPGGTPIASAIAGVFVHYDDSPLFPGTLPALTGTYLAANASFTFTPVFQGGSITALSTTLDGPTGATAFFKSFFPHPVVNTFFGTSCGAIPQPTVIPAAAVVSGPTITTIGALGCETAVGVQFQSPVTLVIPLQPPAAAPSIGGFSPASGPVGTVVTITGAHFTGATAVTLGPDPSPFVVLDDSTIQATVPAGAATGTFSVTTPNGTANSAASFTVLAPPAPAIGDVLSQIQGSTLSARAKWVLSAPLRAAGAAFDRGNTRAARALLGAFINLVQALRRARHVPSTLADALVAQARAIEL